MNREFFINITFLIAINLLIKPFYIFGIDRVVQNLVGKETYGLYFALFNFTYLLQIINDFGIQNYNNRNIAQHNQLLDKYFPNILVLKFFLGLAYLLVVITVAYGLGYEVQYYHLIWMIAINQMLVSLLFYLRSNISGLAMYRTDSIISALDKLLMILICGYLLWWSPWRENFQIEWFIYAQTTSLALSTLVAFFIVGKRLKRFKLRFNPVFLKLILKESYPYALVIFLMTLYTRIDAVMIERLLSDGKAEAGIYASAFRLLDAVNMIGFLFAGLLLPMFSKMLKNKEPLNALLRFSLGLIWTGAIAFSITTHFFRNEIMALLYDEATLYWGSVLGYLIMTFIAVSGTYIYGTLLTAGARLMKMNLIFVVGIILNIVLNYWLILELKAVGAAIATVITQFFVLFAQILLALKIFDLKWDFPLIFRVLLFATGVGLLAYWAHDFWSFDWKISYVLCGLLSIIFSLICGLIQPKVIVEFWLGKSEKG
ncbi:MAG: oligosaccharide flippase family protein [Bacteroidota bacterium]